MPICPSCRAHYDDGVARCAADGEALLPDEAFRAAEADVAPGTMMGEYRVESKLGEGGFGAVYKAVHPVIGKTAAVKVLSRQYSGNPQMVSRFISEARAVNQIRHKNIIDIFAFGSLADGRQYYVMELLDGRPFDKFLRERGRLPPVVALPILRSVARALDAAHSHGVVHRDLKPENVFLLFDDEGAIVPKLLDFGIAKLLSEPVSLHKTRTGAPMGTPNYMSPEQCHGKAVDHRTDIYSLGVMAHLVMTGRLPFDGESVMDVLMKHMNKPAPPMTEHCAELPADLDEPVLGMLAKEPEQRPASAGAAIEAIVAAAQQAGVAIAGPANVSAPALPSVSLDDAIGTAKTAGAEAAALGRTFLPAEADVTFIPRRRTMVVAIVAAAALLAGIAVAVALSSGRTETADGEGASSRSTAAAAATAPLAPSAPPAAASSAATSAPASSSEVVVPFESNPAKPAAGSARRQTGGAPPAGTRVSKDLESPF